MPKGRNRKKGVQSNKSNQSKLDLPYGSSEDESCNDNMSVISNVSGSTWFDDGASVEETPAEDIQQVELFEEKLAEAIDGMSQKSAQGRTSSLESVALAFSKRFIPDFIISRRITLVDCLEKSLKKGRGAEQAVAAQVAALLCVQLGGTDVIDATCDNLIPVLMIVASDTSMAFLARSKCCWALGMLAFIGNYEDIRSVMNCLHQIFSVSCYKNEAIHILNNSDIAALHAAAISAWCLLSTVTPLEENASMLCLKHIDNLLDSNSLEIRLATGELVAVMLEQAREFDTYDEWEPSDDLIDKLRQLATDSHKYRAKKDRKTQRSTFRDIIRYIESGESPTVKIKFGKESLSLDTWSRRKQYDAFCQALGSGMNMHLMQNCLLRDVLDLGEKVTDVSILDTKKSKLERHLINAAAFKARSICRNKNRDKRMVNANLL